jgi:hypothetical protein
MRQIEINSLMDVYSALQEDIITPDKAVEICSLALNMINLKFTNSKAEKNSVLNKILILDDLMKKGWELPIFFFSEAGEFSINDIFNNG